MISNRAVTAVLLIAALAVVASPVTAQYMFLDTNGDGLRTAADQLVLGANTVNVYLNTNHNRNGSLATCDVDGTSPLNINSYYVNLSGTNVTYTLLTNQMGAAFSTHFATSNPGDGTLQDGYGAQLSVPEGLYKLATLTITASTNATVNIVDIIPGSPVADFTGFGTGAGGCFGNDFDNTYKLAGPAGGTDWTDVDGLGPTGGDGPPVLAAIGNKTVSEGSCLTFTATATTAGGGPVVFTLDPGAPSGASITSDGQFSWCPTEAQGPGVYPITVRATETGSPFLSDQETIQVTVNEVNQAPVLAAISNKTVMAGNTLAFAATATDGDLPANTLSFSLDPGAPAGASITSGGNFTWTPTSLQAPGNYLITVRVTDNGVPALSDAKSFSVNVPDREVGAPVITNPGNKTVNEGECLNFTVTATSAGGGTLTFTLGAGAPAGASITSGGQFSWCPTEAQGPGVYTITVNCSDGFQVASANFTVAVLEVNLAPVLAPIGDKTACGPGALVTFTATATDPDIPANTLTFSIDPGAPPGATIGASTGVFSWTPQSGGAFAFTIRVTDNGSPPLSDSETITIIVPLGNQPPILAQPGDMTVTAGFVADQALHATDVCDAATLTFTKLSGPAFVTVTAAGNVHVAPGPTDVGTHVVTVAVSDGGTPSLSDQKSFTVTVLPNDALPVLQPIANMTVDEGGIGTQTIFASEPDNAPLTFVKVSGPFWVLVETTSPTTGLITATPDFSSGGNTYPVTVRATNGTLYDQQSFTISVNEVCQTPVADAGGPYTGQISQPVQFDGTGSSDASGNLTSFIWDFGDGSTGSGAKVSHAYIATGTYMVSLTVANGCGVTHTDQTTVTIFDCHSTQVFVVGGSKQINLQSGKPTWCVQVEAVDYNVADVDLSSIVLRSAGTGSVGEIHALSDKTSVGGDRNGNGLPEITACFRKEDLRQLFSNVTGTQQLQVTLTGNLSTGGSICAATLTITVKGGGGAIAASISPNPLNPSAVLTFTTHERGPVLVQLFDVRGRLLRTLRDEADAAAGYHDVRIDGTTENGARLSSGIYYVRIRAGVEEERKAITILK
jgi:PKD domain-containing protein/putative Ig domain-containing protein